MMQLLANKKSYVTIITTYTVFGASANIIVHWDLLYFLTIRPCENVQFNHKRE